MLSLPKESPERRATLELEGSSPFSSFLKVLDSIQGLNHLVQEISLDKILEADKKAKQLIQHLALLQKDLTKLKEIKRSLANSEQPGATNAYKTPADTVTETGDDPSANRPNPLPKNLIPFPASPRISKVKKEPSPLQTASSFTTSSETEEKQEQKRGSDEGAGFCFGESPDVKTSTPSHYIPAIGKNKEEKPKPSGSTTQPLKTDIGFDEQRFHDPREDSTNPATSLKPYEIIQSRFKSEGDLDRRLKTIVRDYGEVDIYSYRNKDNMKKKAVIVTLLLVLGYFVSSFFFPLHQKERLATALRLQPSVTTERAKVPGPGKNIDPMPLNRRDLPDTFSADTPPTNETERDILDL
jgi:FtsZ-binding cell division protein ZapB